MKKILPRTKPTHDISYALYVGTFLSLLIVITDGMPVTDRMPLDLYNSSKHKADKPENSNKIAGWLLCFIGVYIIDKFYKYWCRPTPLEDLPPRDLNAPEIIEEMHRRNVINAEASNLALEALDDLRLYLFENRRDDLDQFSGSLNAKITLVNNEESTALLKIKLNEYANLHTLKSLLNTKQELVQAYMDEDAIAVLKRLGIYETTEVQPFDPARGGD